MKPTPSTDLSVLKGAGVVPDEPDRNPSCDGSDRTADGKFAPGNASRGGRHKGERNLVTRQLINDILQAYEDRGGVKFLKELPPAIFARLLERILPKKIDLDAKIQSFGQALAALEAEAEAEGT